MKNMDSLLCNMQNMAKIILHNEKNVANTGQ